MLHPPEYATQNTVLHTDDGRGRGLHAPEYATQNTVLHTDGAALVSDDAPEYATQNTVLHTLSPVTLVLIKSCACVIRKKREKSVW